MSDHEEYRIRQKVLKENKFLRNLKEGYWRSPNGNKIVKVVLSYEGEMVNISWNKEFHTSMYLIVWDFLFDDWEYIGKTAELNHIKVECTIT